MDNIPATAGNPVLAAKSVWTSTKFRTAVYSAFTTVLATAVTAFLAALIPKLGAEQVASIAQWIGGIVGGTFATAIGGSAYIDASVQTANGPVAAQAAIAQATTATAAAQATTAQAQATVAKVQEAVIVPPR